MAVQFFQPQTVHEAVAVLAQQGSAAQVLAGGTDLVVHARGGRSDLPSALVHLGQIAALRTISVDDSGALHLGSMVSHHAIERSALVQRGWTALCDASAIVGSPGTRHVGTIGGNLCNGSPAMETGGPVLAYDASVRLVGPQGERTLALKDFFLGPGRTARADQEVLAEVIVPALAGSGARSGSAYLRLEFRKAMEIAIAGVTAALVLDASGAITDCRLALTAVAPVIVRAPEAEVALRGQMPTAEVLAKAGALAAAASSPIDDVRAPAEYRRAMIAVYAVRALRLALERCK